MIFKLWKREFISWALCVILLIFSLYKIFGPKDVKIVTVEKLVSDVEKEEKLKLQIYTLKKKLQDINREIKEDEVIYEVKYSDGRIERRIEKKKVSKEINYVITQSSSVYNREDKKSEYENINVDKITIHESKKYLWTTFLGFYPEEFEIGHGLNINKNMTIAVLYRINERKFGISFIMRW